MIIDLKKAVSYIQRELTRQNVRAVLSDLYPKEKTWCRLLSDVVDSGIVAEIKTMPSVNRQSYDQFIKRMVNGYGIKECYVHKAVNMWISLYSKLDDDVIVPYYSEAEFDETTYIAPYNPNKKQINSVVHIGDYWVKLLSDSTVSIEKFVGTEEYEMRVPSEIDGKRIIGLGGKIFAEHETVRKIIIGEGIQYIGRETFYKCRNLREIKLPSTLYQLGSGVFSYTAISDIELPENLTSLPDGAFRFCENLRQISIPGSVSLIADYAFFGCKSLRKVTITEGVEYIGNNVFDRCTTLKNIYLPKSVKMIMGTMKDHLESRINPTPEKAGEFTISCREGSYAMTYAKSRGYVVNKVEVTDGE